LKSEIVEARLVALKYDVELCEQKLRCGVKPSKDAMCSIKENLLFVEEHLQGSTVAQARLFINLEVRAHSLLGQYSDGACCGCGYCCQRGVCMAGQEKFGQAAPCAGLVWDAEKGRFYCGMLLDASETIKNQIRWALTVGAGCHCVMEAKKQREACLNGTLAELMSWRE
jgi:hypothetical protein